MSRPWQQPRCLVLTLAAAALRRRCESIGETGETTLTDTATTEPGWPEAGNAVVVDRCGTCHTLTAAGTTGTVGPDLDELTPAPAAVEEQVRRVVERGRRSKAISTRRTSRTSRRTSPRRTGQG